MHRPALATALVACFAVPANAHAAEAYDACTGFIDALPAVIATPGTFCLRKDLTTAIAEGNAIEITTDHATLDCNGFRVTGLAGPDSLARGVYALYKSGLAVRDCSIRGFSDGALLFGSGNLVEDSRFENNGVGIYVGGMYDGFPESGATTVRRNRVTDSRRLGIQAIGVAVIADNIIDGIDAYPDGVQVAGIYAENGGSAISGNIIRNLSSSNSAVGIYSIDSPNIVIRDNVVLAMPGVDSPTGILCDPQGSTMGNQVAGWVSGISGCAQYENQVLP